MIDPRKDRFLRITLSFCLIFLFCGISQAQRNSIFSKKPSKIFSNKPTAPKAEKPAKAVKPKAEKPAKTAKPKAEKPAKPKAEKPAKTAKLKAEKPAKMAKPKLEKTAATTSTEKAATKEKVYRPPYPRKCEGDCKDGVGTAYFSHDTTVVYYEGEWKYGDKDGQGMLFYPSGSPKYDGQFARDLENGQGTKYQENSGMIIYEGEWQHGVPNGTGTLHYTNGDKHTGTFAAGKKNGEGIYTFTDGTLLTGVWRNNVLVGKGTLTREEEEVSQHIPHQGKVQSTRCQSPYDCKNGYGVFIYDDGRRYEGDYKDSQYHGQGKFYNAQGILTYEGNWSNHKRNGEGISYSNADGSKEYEGSFADNKRNGYGLSYHPATGTPLYKGDWVDGMFYGEGVLLDKKGRVVFRGTWKSGYMLEERSLVPVSDPSNRF